MKFSTKTNIMKICTRLSIAFTVWYLMFGDSFTILSKNRSIILVILFVLDAIILRYLLNDRMKENKVLNRKLYPSDDCKLYYPI